MHDIPPFTTGQATEHATPFRMARHTLRIAAVIRNAQNIPPWSLRLLEKICAEPDLDLAALILSPDRVTKSGGSVLVKGWCAIERRLAARPQPAVCPNFAQAFAHLPRIQAHAEAAISSLAPDVLLDLSGRPGDAACAKLACHGAWFLDFSSSRFGDAGIASLLAEKFATNFGLFRRVAGRSKPECIAAGRLNPKFMATRNELFMYEKAVPLILRELKRAQLLGAPAHVSGRNFRTVPSPGLKDLARYLCSLASGVLSRATTIISAKAGMRPGMFFLKSSRATLADFDPRQARAHISGRNSYYADPFLWERDGSRFCFFEEYDYRTKKGHISAGYFSGDELTAIRPVLQADYHLSFPFLFEDGGDLFMMPECSAARRIEIWKCVSFPDKWVRHATALEGIAASDSTMKRIGDCWWLFTNISSDPFLDMNTELHVFKVDGPGLGKIEPHALNPVVFDARTARNAGRILEVDGTLLRPSQDNSHGRYGYGLNLMEIETLSLTSYSEKVVRSISPDFEPGLIGCHHIDMRAGRVIMDACGAFGGFDVRRTKQALASKVPEMRTKIPSRTAGQDR